MNDAEINHRLHIFNQKIIAMISKILFQLIKVLLILILPFMILVRGTVYVHDHYDPGARLSIIAGVLITSVVILVYVLSVSRMITGSVSTGNALKGKMFFSLLLVGGFVFHSLYFISPTNFKDPALKSEIRSLNPILRLAVSTLVLIDKDLVITDTNRVPEDYRKMGLPSKKSSLHYEQKDGYAYAIDLRTNGKNVIRNKLTQWYFDLMGFNTLRHGGTADHLHVSLPCHYRPGAI